MGNKDELEETLDEFEMQVMHEIRNPLQPYRVEFPYVCRLSIPDDGHNTEITIRTRSEEVRYGRTERGILLLKETENQDSRPLYSKHILNWVGERLETIDPRDCDLVYPQEPIVTPMSQEQVDEFTDRCLDDE